MLILKGRRSPKVRYQGQELRLWNADTNPFTFLSSIYVSKADFHRQAVPLELLQHELAHKQQRHTLDVLAIELVSVFFWCSSN